MSIRLRAFEIDPPRVRRPARQVLRDWPDRHPFLFQLLVIFGLGGWMYFVGAFSKPPEPIIIDHGRPAAKAADLAPAQAPAPKPLPF